jgi:flagellar basal-body rod protein FlgB
MFTNKVEVLTMARTMARHAAARQAVLAQNLAHADTPGYRARDLRPFAEVWADGGRMRATRAAHLGSGRQVALRALADDTHLSPNGNGVSVEAQMMLAAQTRQDHDMALAIHRSLSGNIRTALGRR